MKVKEIQIDGFGVWTGLSVEALNDGMTLFYGPNEAGKTTLMQFLRAMLYGFSGERRERYFPPVFGGGSGGSLRISGPGGGYQLIRHLDREDEEGLGRLQVTSPDGSRQGQHRLATILGQIDEQIFSNVFAIGLKELQELSSLDDTAAADELYKLSSGLDRVSLVDVMRDLRNSRADLVGDDDPSRSGQAAKICQLLSKRERLRDEIGELIRGGQRWNDLALQQKSQQKEIIGLTNQISSLERESRCIEVCIGVHDLWSQRLDIASKIKKLSAGPMLPDEAPRQLKEIESEIEHSEIQLEEVKEKRREIRRTAKQFPVLRGLSEFKAGIEAASQQIPWLENLDEQIALLEDQLQKGKKQVELDSAQLEFGEHRFHSSKADQQGELPDLSRQSLARLAQPARRVKQQLFLIRQAQSQAAEHRSHADRLEGILSKVLEKANVSDLQVAIRQQQDDLKQIHARIQSSEQLYQLKKRYRELERLAVDLTTAVALPVDRVILLAVPFVFGGILSLYGLAHLVGLTSFVPEPDANWGMLCLLMGSIGLLLFHFGKDNGRRQTVMDRDQCERQIESVRRQIRDLQVENDREDSSLFSGEESLEVRVRAKELMLAELESVLPTFHQHQAAIKAHDAAMAQAKTAEKDLQRAREVWWHALESLGLSRSTAPEKVKTLGADYDRLQLSYRRLQSLESELQQRQEERRLISERITSLYTEFMESRAKDSRELAGSNADDLGGVNSTRARTGPLDQLGYLQDELHRQLQLVKHRSELKVQDQGYKRQQRQYLQSCERSKNHRDSLFVKCGVSGGEQFYHLVDLKAELLELTQRHEQVDQTIKQMIGVNFSEQEIQEHLQEATIEDLEKRWENLTTQLSETEQRVSDLRTLKGEMTQEMKHLSEDARLATRRFELACIERKIDSMTQQWQASAMASFLLEDVCATFEKERQPETLREASAFLHQLTSGKYQRIWTPLGTNQLNVDDASGNTLRIDLLSRGTREAVFISLRLSLAASYARRGVTLPLVLDDVLVNFDRERAMDAVKTLQQFASQGHQVMMFTCHEHIVEMFQEIGVEIRIMPAHGEPGSAKLLSESKPLASKQKQSQSDLSGNHVHSSEVGSAKPVDISESNDDVEGEKALQEGDNSGESILIHSLSKAASKHATRASESEVKEQRDDPDCEDDLRQPQLPLTGLQLDQIKSDNERQPVVDGEPTSKTDNTSSRPLAAGMPWAWFEKTSSEIADAASRVIHGIPDAGVSEMHTEPRAVVDSVVTLRETPVSISPDTASLKVANPEGGDSLTADGQLDRSGTYQAIEVKVGDRPGEQNEIDAAAEHDSSTKSEPQADQWIHEKTGVQWEDAEAELEEAEYEDAEAELEEAEYEDAEAELEEAEYEDAEAELEETEYEDAEAELEEAEYEDAEAELEEAEYEDAEAELEEAEYEDAEAELEETEYEDAEAELEEAEYEDEDAEYEDAEYEDDDDSISSGQQDVA